MHGFARELITEWRRLKLPVEQSTVIVSVSGGADSVSLLLGLHDLREQGKLKLRLVAAHFNHRLRDKESDADEEFVKGLTSRLKVELAIGSADISQRGNLEQNARDARYSFLKETARKLKADLVVTGHSINDQAETFLMNLIRGSGVEGLCGMRAIRLLNDNANTEDEPELPFLNGPLLVRPLLNWAKRIDTEGYCRDQGVEYRYDTMNEDTAFRRVRIRKILLPMLADFNPKIVETLANTARLMQCTPKPEADGNRSDTADELSVSALTAMPEPERDAHVRAWLEHRRGTRRQLGLKHISSIVRLALSTKSGRMVEIPGGRVVKTGGRLRYDDNKVEKMGSDN